MNTIYKILTLALTLGLTSSSATAMNTPRTARYQFQPLQRTNRFHFTAPKEHPLNHSLRQACKEGRFDIVKEYLITHKFVEEDLLDINAPDENGHTPLDLARIGLKTNLDNFIDYLCIIRLLERHGARSGNGPA